jgi:branched-chain amino acid transport system substrate-binding protein
LKEEGPDTDTSATLIQTEEDEPVKSRAAAIALALLVAALALAAAGCGGGNDNESEGTTTEASGGGGGNAGAVEALPASSCSAVYYDGSGDPDYLIASDLPLQGAGRTQTVEMTKAIKFELKQRNFKIGKFNVAYQSCDDSTAQAGKWDSGKCSANANAYARNQDVIGVIGTFNSGCAEIIAPILNRAQNGPVAMISPANTYVGLTHGGPGTAPGEPEKYAPTGKKNYARVVAADDFQGAADAILAKQLGLKKVYILDDKEAYGLGVATNFKNALVKQGVQSVGPVAWEGKASSYEALATKIKSSGADGVFLGGLVCENGGKLIKDLRATLGANVQIMAPDGFTPISAVVEGAGTDAENMTVSVAGLPNSQLKGAGKTFVSDFSADNGGKEPDPYSVYAAQAAQVLLDAIERSDGSRASVSEELFKTDVKDGILGTFKIDEKGDTTSNPVTIYKIKGGKQTDFKVITPPTSLVKSA